jgi:amidase
MNNIAQISMSFEMKNYKALAAEKKAQQWNKIPSGWRLSSDEFNTTTNVMNVPVTCGLLDEAEVEITSEHDATALLEKLKAGTWTVERVTVAFCKRAAIAHQLVSP